MFDLWIQRWRRRVARGEVIVVRYADDFVVGFQHRTDAERLLADLRERLAAFGLALHADKTRLIEFGRFAARDRKTRGDTKPKTFDFLGFTHIGVRSEGGFFVVLRQTMKKRMRAKLVAVSEELRRRMHRPVEEIGEYLRAVVAGHCAYYGVRANEHALGAFRNEVVMRWWRTLSRRSQTARIGPQRMLALARRFIPPARVVHPHPHPLARLGVITQGRSRMR